ncbi:MAG: hypothetical protein ACYCW6_03170 [Candidatus Xenobia bacterium]
MARLAMKLGRRQYEEINISDHPEALPELQRVSGDARVPVAIEQGRVVWAMKFG